MQKTKNKPAQALDVLSWPRLGLLHNESYPPPTQSRRVTHLTPYILYPSAAHQRNLPHPQRRKNGYTATAYTLIKWALGRCLEQLMFKYGHKLMSIFEHKLNLDIR